MVGKIWKAAIELKSVACQNPNKKKRQTKETKKIADELNPKDGTQISHPTYIKQYFYLLLPSHTTDKGSYTSPLPSRSDK